MSESEQNPQGVRSTPPGDAVPPPPPPFPPPGLDTQPRAGATLPPPSDAPEPPAAPYSGLSSERQRHHDAFICHSSSDKTIVDAVTATLEASGVRCWIAPRDVMPGASYVESIVDAIDESRLVVFVFSSSSNDSPHVTRELGRAVNAGVPILPFRIEDITPSPALEFYISGAHWLDAMTKPLKEHLDHLAFTAHALLGMQHPDPAASAPAAVPTAGGGGLPGGRWPWLAAGAVALLLVLAVVVGVVSGGGDDEQAGTNEDTVDTAEDAAGGTGSTAGAELGPEGEAAEPGDLADPLTLAVGTCFLLREEGIAVEVVDCDEPHDEEVAARLEHPAGTDEDFPGSDALDAFVDESCNQAFEDYTGQSYLATESFIVYGIGLYGADDWNAGGRTFVCLIASFGGEKLTEPARESG